MLISVAAHAAAPAGSGSREQREIKPLRIGVLVHRSPELTTRTWSATASALADRLPSYQVTLVPAPAQKLDQAVATHQVDFVLTQPEHYVRLRSRYGLAAVATLMPLAEGHPVTQFGGVIFTRPERQDIQRLEDLRGKVIAAVQPESLGAYRMQQWALRQVGISLPEDVKTVLFTGIPQDNTVQAVLNGRADAGFARTGIIEAMVHEGRLSPDALRIINPQPPGRFPQRLSTDLYPEWPLAARNDLPEPLVKAVTMALLQITPDTAAARQGNYYGFSPPLDYSALEAMMQRLGAHPDYSPDPDFQDLLDRYRNPILLTLALLSALTLAGLASVVRAKRRLAVTLSERASLLDSLGEGIYGVDRKGNCTFINPIALGMLGLSQEQVLGQNQHLLFHHRRPDGTPYPQEECPIFQTLTDGQRREVEDWFLRADGSPEGKPFPVRLSVTPILRGGETVGAVTAFQDIAASRRAQEEMRIAAIAFETQEAIVITDAQSRILRVNQAFTNVTGYSAAEAMGKTPALLKSGHHGESFYRDMWATLMNKGRWHGEVWNRRKNGEIYPEWLTISSVKGADGRITHYVAAFLDISQHKQAEEQIQFLAFYDPLTHLPNRRLLQDNLSKALATAVRQRRHGALLFIDLDNFKTLNDSLGHDFGDLLLREVANRLQKSVRTTDTVARLGGDEFVVILEGLERNLHQAAARAEAIGRIILANLAQPYSLGEDDQRRDYRCSASIGLVLFMEHEATVEDLLKCADLAMYRAKAGGRNTLRFFDPAMQTEVEARATLESDLHRALDREEFVVFYQPQVNRQGQRVGAEALLRWRHPEQGLVSPDQFIPLAEETGLILPLGLWVLHQACRELARLQRQPATAQLVVAVNVSTRQFRDERFVDDVLAALAASGAQGRGLKLEITESLFAEDADTLVSRMRTLQAHGVGFSLDDFGTGYSSLAYLKRLPLDQLKIDRSFIHDLLDNPNDAAIAQTIIALGQTLGLTVVAEGVETRAQQDFLEAQGCALFQGYLHGRAQSPEEAFGDLTADFSHV